MPALLILLACCGCTVLSVDTPRTAVALVRNVIATYERDDLLQADFYSDDNLRRLSGAATVERLRSEKPGGAGWDERSAMNDFVNMEKPTKVWRPDLPIPHVRFEPSRVVKDGKIITAYLFVSLQSDYATARRSVIAPLLGPGCQEDVALENTTFMAITSEPFNPPLGRTRSTILSCVGKRKKMTLRFALAEAGADPMLQSINIFQESK